MTGHHGPYTQVIPGLYRDRDGAPVWDIGEVLRQLGREDTPENRRLVTEELTKLLAKANPGQPLFSRGPDSPFWREVET